MTQDYKGIQPELLISQVRNTMPYLFGTDTLALTWDSFPPARLLRTLTPELNHQPPPSFEHLGLPDYYQLCVSSHYLTCATPVPTDVDNPIRKNLWAHPASLESALAMAEFILDTRSWDFTRVSERWTRGASGSSFEKEVLSGHSGEWFTVACGAYGAMAQYQSSAAKQMKERLHQSISEEVHRESEIFGSLWRAGDGLNALKACASIAHNFGDLDRVMDMWDLSVTDPLRLDYYKLTASPFDSNKKLRHQGRLWVAGELYKSTLEGTSMAAENHRHFALRKPRILRQNRAFLIPIGPFFDSWGFELAQTLKNSPEFTEVIEALIQGWTRLSRTIGYGRAIAGILENIPNLDHPELKSLRKNRSFRLILETPQDRFERKWHQEALRLLDDIPSRA